MVAQPELPADIDPRWCLVVDGLDPALERAREALLALADGRIGVGGALVADHDGQRRWTVAAGVYVGDGPAAHLLPAPVALQLPYRVADGARVRRVLDLRDGVLSEDVDCDAGPLRSARFCSLARPGLVALVADCPDQRDGPALVASTEGELNDQGVDVDVEWAAATGRPGGVVAAARETRRPEGAGARLTRLVAYETSPDERPDPMHAVASARWAAEAGFDVLLNEQRETWAARWRDGDVVIDGDDELQLAVRFALFHLTTSAGVEGEAAVGARGLTGESYRGHVFWDADVFVLPSLAATRPAAARAMLEYRVRRLGVARELARNMGQSGARFPWESAHSGRDVTPTSALDWTGRRVLIRTGQLEDHIVADVAWASCCYVDWTGDEDYARGPGLQLLVDTARYWRSRVRVDVEGAHIYGVIGPDEYHEPVDDNAYTNVMARWNLRRAVDAVERAEAETGVGADELRAWRRIADTLLDGYDARTGLYQQFAGFSELEPLVIAEVAPRRPVVADLLLGSRRVQEAQVLKQADVLMLHHLVPDEVEPGSLEPNLDFYEPRTAHGSSLSPPVHSALLARAGRPERALEALRLAAFMDRDDLSGTTAGGLHLATMGGLWQAVVMGFAGIRPRGRRLVVDPHLPAEWDALAVRVLHRGSRVHVRCEHDSVTVTAEPASPVRVGGTACTATPDGVRLRRRGATWERVP